MTLSSFQSVCKKSEKEKLDFVFTFAFIESYKRDYFYPIFAEIYRRKGFLTVANSLDIFSKKTSSNFLLLDKVSFIILQNNQFSVGAYNFVLDQSFSEMKFLLDRSVQQGISSQTNFYQINDIFLQCLRFNCEYFYPSLLSHISDLVKNSEGSARTPLLEIAELLHFIVEIEIKNLRLIEKKLHS